MISGEIFNNKGILKERDHLLQIAGIRQSQVLKFNSVGITTMHQLAETDLIESLKIEEKSYNRLQSQAKMQIKSEETGRISYGVLDNIEPGLGLYSLPPKSSKDIYFDIESNTLL